MLKNQPEKRPVRLLFNFLLYIKGTKNTALSQSTYQQHNNIYIMSKLLEKLNEAQKKAVLITDGPLLVIAGAGSGKTRVLTHKIAYLIESGINPENILAVTFTNKAAKEMKERVKRLAENNNQTINQLNIGTFHSISASLLRRHATLLGYGNNFVIFDSDDQLSLVKSIMQELDIDIEKFKPQSFLARISSLKTKLKNANQSEVEAGDFFARNVAAVYAKYEHLLKEQNAMDFDDLITLFVKLLRENKEILEKYQEKFKYVFIDEYQDTNSAQYNLVRLLAQKSVHLCAVGDNDQAIYGWRDADYRNILNFEKDYPKAQKIILEENYRSTQNILNAANGVIKKNPSRYEKNLFTKNGSGAKINLILAQNEQKEAEFIAKKIAELTRKYRINLSGFAVLYRTNSQSRAMEEALMKLSIPYNIIGGFKFYHRKEVKDVLAYLRYLYNEKDTAGLKRIINTPPRGIGKVALDNFFKNGIKTKNIEAFFEMMKSLKVESENMKLSKLLREIVKKSGIEKTLNDGTKEGIARWENILELFSVASVYDNTENSALKFLENAALISDQDGLDQTKPMVSLMTVHTAKGLEFDIVFIIGLEDGVFPHERSKSSQDELEEERRLCYVALTRAKKELYLLHTEQRRAFGKTQSNPPSRFLYDLPQELIEFCQYPSFYSSLDRDGLDENLFY